MSDGLQAAYKLSAKIERLEAELAEMRERYDAEVKRVYVNAGRASVAEAELAEMREIATAEGYVKLDVDVEALREALHSYWETTSLVYRVARQVLAALDGKAT